MDVDGTLTDGKLYIGDQGEVFKKFDVKDGYGIHDLLRQYDIIPMIITGRQSKILEYRANELGISHLFQGVKDKIGLLKGLAEQYSLSLQEISFIGDDLNDIECMKMCGLSGCPSDAVSEVRKIVDYISPRQGGDGAVRDFIEYVISNNENYKVRYRDIALMWRERLAALDYVLLLVQDDEQFNHTLCAAFKSKLGTRRGMIVGGEEGKELLDLYSLYAFTDKMIVGSFDLPFGRKLRNLLDCGIASEEELINDVLLGVM